MLQGRFLVVVVVLLVVVVVHVAVVVHGVVVVHFVPDFSQVQQSGAG